MLLSVLESLDPQNYMGWFTIKCSKPLCDSHKLSSIRYNNGPTYIFIYIHSFIIIIISFSNTEKSLSLSLSNRNNEAAAGLPAYPTEHLTGLLQVFLQWFILYILLPDLLVYFHCFSFFTRLLLSPLTTIHKHRCKYLPSHSHCNNLVFPLQICRRNMYERRH